MEQFTEPKGIKKAQNWKAIRNAAWIYTFWLFFLSPAGLPLRLDLSKDFQTPEHGPDSRGLSLKLSLGGAVEDIG